MVKCIEAESCGEKFLIPISNVKAFGKGKILVDGIIFHHDLPDEDVVKMYNREKNTRESMYEIQHEIQEEFDDSEVY